MISNFVLTKTEQTWVQCYHRYTKRIDWTFSNKTLNSKDTIVIEIHIIHDKKVKKKFFFQSPGIDMYESETRLFLK